MKNRYIVDNKITNKFVEAYTKTTYRIVGKNKHSAIKPCHWFEQRLMTGRDNRNCYKGVFGIQSHRCLQNTPSLPFCNHQCVFCWRDVETGALGSEFLVDSDDPKSLIDEMIRQQRDIVKNHLPLRRYIDNYEIMVDLLYFMLQKKSSYDIKSLYNHLHVSKTKIERAFNLLKNREFLKSVDDSLQFYKVGKDIAFSIHTREEVEELVNRVLTDPDDIMKAHNEAMTPNHAAISLDGEPMLYPEMDGLVGEFRNRNMTTFIVTNGTLPKKIEALNSLPSQLYITLPACNQQMYKKICRPMVKNGWERIMDSLKLINSLSCRTVIRLTAIKELNINDDFIEDYVKIIEKANPSFFEIKGFTLQAKALLIKDRLKSEKPVQAFFPDYKYLEDIALKFEEYGSFSLIYKNKPSRDFLFAVNWKQGESPKIKTP